MPRRAAKPSNTRRDRKKLKAATKRKAAKKPKGAQGYKVGYRNPPLHTRFRRGKTGNRMGRPKGSKNLRTLIMEAARDHVTAIIDGKKRTISKAQATTMQLATKAAGGNQAAMNKLLDWIDEIETGAAVRPTQFPLSAPDLEVLRAVYERMIQCEPE